MNLFLSGREEVILLDNGELLLWK